MVKKKASKTKAEDSPQDSSLLDMSNRAVKKMIKSAKPSAFADFIIFFTARFDISSNELS